MRLPITVRLTNYVWGYVGKAAGQLEDETVPDVYFIAGDYQVWVPGLTFADVTQISALPYLAPAAPPKR